MKGVVSDRVTRAAVPGVLVSLWSPDDRTNPLAVTVTDDGGVFALETGVDSALPIDKDVVLRVHRSADGGVVSLARDRVGATEFGPQLAVQHVPFVRQSRVASSVWVDDAFGERWRFFARLAGPDGAALTRVNATVAGPRVKGATTAPVQAVSDTGGYLGVSYPADALPAGAGGGPDGSSVTLRVWTASGPRLAADWTTPLTPIGPATEVDLSLDDPGSFTVTGSLTAPTGATISGLDVELLDRSGVWANPVAAAESGAAGEFILSFPRWLPDQPPKPTVVASDDGRRVASLDVSAPWVKDRIDAVNVPVSTKLGRTLAGQVLNRLTRQPVAGMRVELWTVTATGPGTLTQAASSDADGGFRFTVAVGVDSAPPPLVVRLFAGSTPAGDHPIEAAAWRTDPATVFLETDVVPQVEATRITGRVVDSTTRSPLPALRIEAWDRTPRNGGMLGVATFAASDGSFELSVPAPSGLTLGATRPLFFRIYAGDNLLATSDGEVAWSPDGSASVVLAVSASVQATDDVVLHELGETLAGTVNRMQLELGRYPSTMGAFVVDELDLTVPVAVRLDALGQVRTKVLEQAPADGTVGQVRMRVRPVVGATGGATQPLVQPLSVLTALTPTAIAALNSRRIYSVEDLARLAVTAAGRAALGDLHLGLDLDELLGTAALLAMPVLPLRVRQELVDLGVTSLRAFVDGDADQLAAGLTTGLAGEIAQPVSADDVRAWQRPVRDMLSVPLPTSQQ